FAINIIDDLTDRSMSSLAKTSQQCRCQSTLVRPDLNRISQGQSCGNQMNAYPLAFLGISETSQTVNSPLLNPRFDLSDLGQCIHSPAGFTSINDQNDAFCRKLPQCFG